ncbi:transporter substrate-binding domain-containing protein [Streptococcus henryi]|uniref:transporter substrate-binding domain-containing protein n=1 Tax=Streptococcus henryi TaxID=439219 RepID=UPI00037D8EE6
MKKITLSILTLLMVICSAIFFTANANADTTSAQVNKIKESGVLRVGVKQDVPNFGYLDPDTNKFSGIEVELAKKIAKKLGVKVAFTPVTAATRGALLDNEQVDIVIATFTITEERRKLYNFTTPYYTDAVGFLINKDSGIKSFKDLDGKTIGVSQGSITQLQISELAKENGISVKFAELGSYPELSVSLRAHRTDAFSVDQSILSGYVSSKTQLLDFTFAASQYGVVTKKSNTELDEYLSGLIDGWTEDGTLQAIYDKYDLTPASIEEDN